MNDHQSRPRRLCRGKQFWEPVAESGLSARGLIQPYFLLSGSKLKENIPSLPGRYHWSVDMLIPELDLMLKQGIQAVLLFGLPEEKDPLGKEAHAATGVIQQAVRQIKKSIPELTVITDVCLCAYTDHGHCGILRRGTRDEGPSTRAVAKRPKSLRETNGKACSFEIDNEATLEVLAKIAVSHAEAGADLVAPSAMADRQVEAIRAALDKEGHCQTGIMGYSAKFASAFYQPFRAAVKSAPAFGDRRSYQLNPANRQQALREVELDIQEGADIVMVKPALSYLDIIREVKNRFSVPLAAYNVSGEYAMVKAVAGNNPEAEKELVWEILLSIKRAGADIIISYWARQAAQWLQV